ncbi:hypothetical protein Bca52824_063543 [Brassica carinata]|uniref:C3H1-type domain-containing protein n=1 Tax=Brassica carinata TaxID=52824 RepID=A0A8X7QFW1_BRACI|nr:hypothetical protein Bca52824_063543 [Brassica carinata]
MDSSHYKPSYTQWNSPYSPHHPPAPLLPPPPPPPPRQSHPDSPNFYVPSSHNGGQRQDYHHYSHRQDLPPNPAVDYPSSYYPHHPPPPPPHQHHPPQQHQPYIPQQVSYESQRASQPSSSTIPFTESRDVSQSPWVDSWTDAGPGRMDTGGSRLDPSPSRDYRYDYSRSSRDSSGVISINRGLDGSSRSRDEFRNTGYVRKESRIEGSYQDRGQLNAESDRCFRGLGQGNRSLASRVGYGTDRYGVSVSRDMGREDSLSPKKDDYYHSETEQYFDRGRREESSELNRTPRKQMQKKSALLRLETPRNHQKGRENGRNHSNYNGKRFHSNLFRGKEHLGRSDRGLVEKQRERTPVDLDVSFESNLLVAKPIASPASAGIHPSRSMTPRSFKARRALVPDKSENPSVTEGNGKLRLQFSDEASVSEGSRPSKRQNISSEIEKKPDNYLTPSSSDAGGMNKVSFVDGVVQDCEVKITDGGPEALTRDSEAKVRSTLHAAEKISNFCEALKEAKDDSKRDSNMEACSIKEDFIEGDKSILKSQDVLDRTGCNTGEALPLKVMEMEDIVKASTNRSPTKLLVPLSTAADISEYSEAVIGFSRKSMCSVESHPCEDVDMDCSPSRNVPTEEVNTGFEENGSNGINKNVDSLCPENNCRWGLVSSASLEIPSVSTELANANNNISGDLANAHSFTIGTCTNTNTIVDLPDMSGTEKFVETTPLSSVAEMADNLNSDEGKKACVKGTSSSLSEVDVKGSLIVLPVERTEGYPRSDESDLAMAVCMENVSAERLAPDEDLNLASHHPAEIPSVDQLSGSNNRSLKACLPEPNVSLNKDITDGLSVGLVQRDVSQNDSTFMDPSRVSACLVSDISPLMAMNEQIQNKESIQTNYSESQGGIMHEENNFAENIAIDTQEEKKTNPSGGNSKCRTLETDIVVVTGNSVFFGQIPSETHVAATVDETYKDKQKPKHSGGTSEYRTQGTDIVAFSGDSVPSDSLSNSPKLYRQIQSETHVVSMADDSNNYKEKAKPSADVTSDVGGQEKYSLNSIKTDIFNGEALSADRKVSGTEILGDSGVHLSSRADVKFALTHVNDHAKSVPDRDPQNKTSLKIQLLYSEKLSPFLPFVSDTKKNANPPNKHHTWHRKLSPAASSFVAAKPLSSTFSTQQKVPIVTAQSSNSYVRKGNSLLRKPSDSPGVTLGLPLSAIQLNRIENKSTGSASSVDVGNASFLVKAGEIPTLVKQSKPPSDSSTSKVSNAIGAPSGKRALSYSMDHPTTYLPDAPHSGGDTSKTSDTPIQTDYASDCQQKKIPPKLDSSDLKRTVYVKRKANQLVAASDIHSTSRSQIPTSDGYFKRNKNQLVRTSESRVNYSPDDALDSRASATMVSERRSSSSAFSDSAVTRPYKRSKFSLVWLQDDPQSGLPSSHMRYRRILPQLVPWKRVTYWRRLMNSVSALRNGSFPNTSQKLSTMRKRHTVYTRSTNGYSLRKSKVLSIGGSHLKWSKSIERDSRKANEEATLAVAAFSKKENEKHSGQSSTRKASRNHLTRERIFRFGSLRYKMDPSRRTLQRISDVYSPCSGPTENGKAAKRPFIPKRLVIGNEEYVRVGNGNQLVRDPKKRTRALANEKVRWSLHNVRLRLAKKKKKYCQFFTRFGKCNKDDGKCPYVHDPSKIAVCTKFLNGLCANENCKLTHKVIPERMPDCSYFLQGLCNNEACPYRHVHVNPSACRKKHSYTCPDFEATGSCSQGSKCKLHHPKNQGKGRKRKRPSEPSEKNARGRYFGSLQKLFSESEPMVVDRHPTESEDFGTEGIEFISLGATEEEAGDNNDQATEQSISSESEEPASIYELIRPVALMR